ncbi:DUF1273 domain-containing protein [Paenibacillus aurantius]|uniref:UPF0398 protein MJA45_21235 n=1 Tax=Paenibacillus aurantius TaxID=2918900 RepID=A0AA96LDJ5_9BACL|nr:DUF1273 domain-containing protein [Paenibacillus aurantius]WNQ10126.1 DUF1273 domain-containing protein [Paenibacillus aurantius]
MKTVLVTGYKAAELGIYSLKHEGIPIIKKALRKRIEALLDEGLEWVIVSGQWGVELWAAEAALELKEDHPQLRLAVITPFLEQEERWKDDKKECYQEVLRKADYVNSVSHKKYEGPWQFKETNKFLLRNSDGLLLVYDEDMEGSPRFLKELARSHAEHYEYPILTITAEDLQSTAEEQLPDFDGQEG